MTAEILASYIPLQTQVMFNQNPHTLRMTITPEGRILDAQLDVTDTLEDYFGLNAQVKLAIQEYLNNSGQKRMSAAEIAAGIATIGEQIDNALNNPDLLANLWAQNTEAFSPLWDLLLAAIAAEDRTIRSSILLQFTIALRRFLLNHFDSAYRAVNNLSHNWRETGV